VSVTVAMNEKFKFRITMIDSAVFEFEMAEATAQKFIQETLREGYLDEGSSCFYPAHAILKVGMCEPCAATVLRSRFSLN
jgi:hypothetical protein